MVDISQPNHRTGRRHQAQSTNASNTNASAADLQRQNDINRLLHVDIAAVESQVTLNDWLLGTIQLFYERLEQFESVDDVEGKQRLIDWMLEQFDAWDALPRFNPRTLQVEDRTAAEQNAALTRVTNRLSRLNQRIDQLEERIPEDDEHWARVLELTREAADPYVPPRNVPPQHVPPQHVPVPSNPHQYGPVPYNYLAHDPHQHCPLPHHPHTYGIPSHTVPPHNIHPHDIPPFHTGQSSSSHPAPIRRLAAPQPGIYPPTMPRPSIPNEAPRRIPMYSYEVDATGNEIPRRTARDATNGVTTNGVATNGVTTNGVTTNGVTTNGVTTNGMTTNGVTTDEVTTDEEGDVNFST